MDSTIPQAAPSASSELQAKVDSLSIDGTAPSVGDTVELKVSGEVTKVLNGTAFVKPTMVNDMPVEDNEPDEPDTDMDDPRAMASMADQGGSYGGY